MAADGVDDAGPALLLQRLARRGELGAVDDRRRRRGRLQVVGLGRLAGRGDHAVAEPRQQRDGDAADAAGRAGDQHRRPRRAHAVPSPAPYAQHRGVAGGADRHRLPRREAPPGSGTSQSPFEPRLLRQAAPVRLADAPAVEHDLVAGLEPACRLSSDRAGEVDARHHRELAHHRRPPVIARPSL